VRAIRITEAITASSSRSFILTEAEVTGKGGEMGEATGEDEVELKVIWNWGNLTNRLPVLPLNHLILKHFLRMV
jgi:hypothetical protein